MDPLPFPFEHLDQMRPLRRKRGKRWLSDPMLYRCTCGAHATSLENMRNGDRLIARHARPDGSPCPEVSHQEARERTARIVAQALGPEFAP